MPANRYEFRDTWRIPFPIEDVWDILADPLHYPVWWHGVYLSARAVSGGGQPEVGSQTAVVAKGWMPYRLRFTLETLRLERPTLIEIRASGDFKVDRSSWALRQVEGYTEAVLNWNPLVEKALVRLFSPVAKPLFRSNHSWAMRRGEKLLIDYMTQRKSMKT